MIVFSQRKLLICRLEINAGSFEVWFNVSPGWVDFGTPSDHWIQAKFQTSVKQQELEDSEERPLVWSMVLSFSFSELATSRSLVRLEIVYGTELVFLKHAKPTNG